MGRAAHGDGTAEAGGTVTAPDRRPLRRPGRTPGTANLGVAVAVLAVLLPLLLNAATAAPPTAAEFSPNASQVIKKAPPGQAAAVNGTGEGKAPGKGPGKGTGEGGSPSPSPVPTIQVPPDQLKQCVGPPPLRQIEDPQSPPCIAYWQGDNGGATAKGVTRENIYVAIPTPKGFQKEYVALQAFFNRRFQFYGRKLVFQFCSPMAGADSNGSGGQDGQVQDAATASQGCGNGIPPFASNYYQFDNGRYFNQQMACRYKTVMVASYTPFDTSYMKTCAPYLYQYTMASELLFDQLGEWGCARLAGRPARFGAGTTSTGAQLNATKRKFGIFLAPFYHDDPVARRSALKQMTDRLKACGAEVPADRIIINPVTETNAGQSLDPASASNAISQMRRADVTSIFCMCGVFPFGALARAASSNGYQPEWLGSTYGILDDYNGLLLSAAPTEQLAHLFGISILPRHVDPLLEPYNVGIQEGDPAVAARTSNGDFTNFTQLYRPLLLLAAGIQMAGPKLTAESFRAGLLKTTFPNPVTSLNAGDVGMESQGYSFTRDATEWWYSTSAKGPYSDDDAGAKGAICYLDAGRRYHHGTWVRKERTSFGACDSGA